MMDTVASSPSSRPALVKLIEKIYSTIRTTQKPKPPKENPAQPIEIEHDWPYTHNGEILPYLDCWPVQEHCIGLCQSPRYRLGRENMLYLSLNFLPLDWKSYRQIILKSMIPTKTRDLGAYIEVFKMLLRMLVKNGEGQKAVNMGVVDGHLMMRIITVL